MSLASEFERCRPWLERSLAASAMPPIETVWAELEGQRAQLWPAPDAAAVTQVSADDDAGLVLTLWVLGGRLTTLLRLLPIVEAEMAGHGVTETRFGPHRAGWKRLGALLNFRELRPGVWGRKIDVR